MILWHYVRQSDTKHIIAQGMAAPNDCRSRLQIREQANVVAKRREICAQRRVQEMQAAQQAITANRLTAICEE